LFVLALFKCLPNASFKVKVKPPCLHGHKKGFVKGFLNGSLTLMFGVKEGIEGGEEGRHTEV
jgi:hypothetical protein